MNPRQEEYLNGLQGHPITELTAKMGPPGSQQIVGDEHWYTWTNDHLMQGFAAGTTIHGQCRFSVRASQDGAIRSWRWQGNAAGCQALFRPLP